MSRKKSRFRGIFVRKARQDREQMVFSLALRPGPLHARRHERRILIFWHGLFEIPFRLLSISKTWDIVKICQPVEIMRYHQDVPSSNTPVLSPSMVFFINHFLGFRAEALRATVVDFTSEPVPARGAFHFFLFAPGDLILRIIAKERVGADRTDDVHRIDSA